MHSEFIPSSTLNRILKLWRNGKHDFSGFFLAVSNLSFSMTMLDHTHLQELHRLDVLVSPSWIPQHIVPHWSRRIFIFCQTEGT